MTAPPLAPETRARVAVPFAIVTLVWGSTWLAIRYQFGIVPPAWSIAYRFAIAAIVMIGVAFATSGGVRIARRLHALAAAIGVAQFLANYQFVYGAERHIASGLVAVISALILVANAVLARIFLRQQLSRPFLIGSAVALAGIGLLFAHELGRDGADGVATALGVGLAVCGLLSASVANVLQGTAISRTVPAGRLLAWAMLYGTIGNVTLAWVEAGAPLFEPTPRYIAALLYLAVVGSVVTFTLYLGLIRAIGPARAAYSSVLSPVIAMALSTLFEGYRWSATAGAGAALTLVGLVLALRARRPAR